MIRDAGTNSVVLEYGCGRGSSAFELAGCAARVKGIDISGVAIEQATEEAGRRHLGERVSFAVMDAEHLAFETQSFDLVCGNGILHHLNVDRALSEVARVLKPNGRAIFWEPLGENVLLNLYRRLTPRFRSRDEHPLRCRDFFCAESHFSDVEITCYNLVSMAAYPFHRTRYFERILYALDELDALLFRIPGLRYQGWMCLMELNRPIT